MKKLLALGFLSLAALGIGTQPASAWWPCFPLLGCGGCSRCCTTVCLRQYNAFTPICCGNLSCDGCCPMTFGGMGCNPCCTPSCGPSACIGGDACCLGQLPAAGAISNTPAPPATAGAPGYQAPLPNPADGPRPMSYSAPMPMNPYMMQQYQAYMGMIQQAAYQQAAYQQAAYQQAMQQNYMPAPNPYAGQAPYYWNGGGR